MGGGGAGEGGGGGGGCGLDEPSGVDVETSAIPIPEEVLIGAMAVIIVGEEDSPTASLRFNCDERMELASTARSLVVASSLSCAWLL